MYRALILPLARKDIRNSAFWYEKQHQGLGRKFMLQVRDKVLFIQQNPESFNVKYDEVRTAILATFPYQIHYSINENNKSVIISAVFHTSRNPKILGER